MTWGDNSTGIVVTVVSGAGLVASGTLCACAYEVGEGPTEGVAGCIARVGGDANG